jgi:hypothetical protein
VDGLVSHLQVKRVGAGVGKLSRFSRFAICLIAGLPLFVGLVAPAISTFFPAEKPLLLGSAELKTKSP